MYLKTHTFRLFKSNKLWGFIFCLMQFRETCKGRLRPFLKQYCPVFIFRYLGLFHLIVIPEGTKLTRLPLGFLASRVHMPRLEEFVIQSAIWFTSVLATGIFTGIGLYLFDTYNGKPHLTSEELRQHLFILLLLLLLQILHTARTTIWCGYVLHVLF